MSGWNRRDVIGSGGSSLLALGVPGAVLSAGLEKIAIVADPGDPLVKSSAVAWALDALEAALQDAGHAVVRVPTIGEAGKARTIVVAGFDRPLARRVLGTLRLSPTDTPEATALLPIAASGTGLGGVLASGSDARGLSYALLELVDRLRQGATVAAALTIARPAIETPANPVRSISRLFVSDVEDLAWFHDREGWRAYFAMLATHRFNRFTLGFGLAYDFLRNVTDASFLFLYPFLLDVPGYRVRVPQLPVAERDRNLETLRFIGEEADRHGVDFHLGLWMHGYEWANSPDANYTVEGLTRDTHGPYCRDALRLLLTRCPAIRGVTMRIHGESGVPEGDFSFWKTVFEGLNCGRPMRVDMHAKGLSEDMIRIALATGHEVTVSPKFWAEHLGMPYHQAEIREIEQPHEMRDPSNGLMRLSAGSRSFLRYGYGDLLREGRKWKVVHRVWPGTRRLLLSGDPASEAAYARAYRFCGSDGAEIFEPLTFKGRRGTGHPGGRCAYQDTTLKTRWDWEKFEYTYRLWGRTLYDPDVSPTVWRRALGRTYGAAAPQVETALAAASRILPIVTTAHLPSAANNLYWPEIYFNQSLVDAEHYKPYDDTPKPRVFGSVSPLDPEMFLSIADAADELLSGRRSGRYSPIEVATWLTDRADRASAALARTAAKKDAAFRRMAIDVEIQAGLGRFFAAKFRAGVLFVIFQKTGDGAAHRQAIAFYRQAREAWAAIVRRTEGVYVRDISVGEEPEQRGHWSDRLAAIDADIAAVEKVTASSTGTSATAAIATATKPWLRTPPAGAHRPPASFTPGRDLVLSMTAPAATKAVTLRYRHVDQAERFEQIAAERRDDRFVAAIPAAYASADYPLQYYFVLDGGTAGAALSPGFDADLTNQPYFVVRPG